MTTLEGISAAVGSVLLMGATATDDEPSVPTSVQAGQWHCGTQKDSKAGYQCDEVTFHPGFGGNPKVYLSLGKVDLAGSGFAGLESIELKVAQASWSGFQPEVEATGWTDSSKTHHVEMHKSGNWGGTWIAVGPPLSDEKKR